MTLTLCLCYNGILAIICKQIATVVKRLELYKVVPRVPVHCVPNFKWLNLLLLKLDESVLKFRALLPVSGIILLHTKILLVTGTPVL